MKTLTMLGLTVAVMSLIQSCSSNTDAETDILNSHQALIGDWKISKYIFVNNLNGLQIGSAAPDCSGKNLYQLRTDNFLNVRMYKNVYGGACQDTPTNDNGVWSYDSNTKMISFYGDAHYKVKSISENQLEIENFDEGYVDYSPKDYNYDGVVDKVITVLVKQ